jgi:hypothetical protein
VSEREIARDRKRAIERAREVHLKVDQTGTKRSSSRSLVDAHQLRPGIDQTQERPEGGLGLGPAGPSPGVSGLRPPVATVPPQRTGAPVGVSAAWRVQVAGYDTSALAQ